MKNKETELSELGSLMISPIKKVLEETQHQGKQYLWRSKKLTKKPTSLSPFSDDRSPSKTHLTVVDNDESK
ncbi:hypothetical protein [Vibrio fluvialis]|uniref:hypothetical protein n=1 Tax=Vibrio fluvialis TaxID=676 RepID=UPI0023A990AC|nr:hypothetical protein [Vibrio fluvialis]MDE5179149.1 hypothetical protein [Vibrio fluvialis]